MSPELYFLATSGMLAFTYVTKLSIIRSKLDQQRAFWLFIASISMWLPIIYRFAPNWSNRFVSSSALIIVGEPVALFGVPFLSFVFDLSIRERTTSRRFFAFYCVRSVIEAAFILTIWRWLCVYAWLRLGWLWI